MAEAGVRMRQNYVGGIWVDGRGGGAIEDRNPANPDDLIGLWPRSTPDDMTAAVDAAVASAPGWAGTSALTRGAILLRAAALLVARAEEVATAMTREEGKTLREARGETARGVAILRYYAGEGAQPIGEVYPSANTRTMLYTMHVPLGVVGVITPWNFPVAIPLWKIAPALVYGNTVVFKPAELTPLTATLLVQILEEAGLPAGVLNFVVGYGSEVGPTLTGDERVTGVSFTGSNRVGREIRRAVEERGGKAQLELGGKNPVVVLADADLDQAAALTVQGAMMSAGQKCTATSRAIVERVVLESFTRKVVEHVKALVVGDGADEATNVSPLVSAAQRDRVTEYFDLAREEGVRTLAGGRLLEGAAYRGGHFVQPTVYADVRPDSRLAREEIFGPVLAIIPAADASEAIKIANDVPFGLSASIFTRDIAKALRFTQDIQAGIVHVNSETAGAEPQVPFGGMKGSSSFSREQGKAATHFFTQVKTVYLDEPATSAPFPVARDPTMMEDTALK